MLFHTFSSQEERRAFGGSDFLEIQFCRMLPNTSLQGLVEIDNIRHWLNDSLYVNGDDSNAFLQAYGDILGSGVYNNLESGPIDPYGVNYYGPERIDSILAKLGEQKRSDDIRLVDWLTAAKAYHGFYILGV